MNETSRKFICSFDGGKLQFVACSKNNRQKEMLRTSEVLSYGNPLGANTVGPWTLDLCFVAVWTMCLAGLGRITHITIVLAISLVVSTVG